MFNEYWVFENTELDANDQLKPCSHAGGIILERSLDGIVHIWPMSPTFSALQDPAITEGATENEDYLIDGDWAVEEPWMYFPALSDVVALLNRQNISLSYRDLGWLPSIRTARAIMSAKTV